MGRSSADLAFLRYQQTGEPEALAAVFDATAAELLRVASHLARDLHAAEDLVQQTFFAAIERRDRYVPATQDSSVLSWLLGILTHRARRLHRENARSFEAERVTPQVVPDPFSVAASHELTESLSNAIACLPESYRSVLQFLLAHGLSAAEIAIALERPPGTVRSQIARGLEQIRRLLPAGFAVGVAGLATPVRGLAAMRAGVLDAALHAKVITIAAPIVAGGILGMKKVLAAVVVAIVALVFAAQWLGSGGDPMHTPRQRPHLVVEEGDWTELEGVESREKGESREALQSSDRPVRATVDRETGSVRVSVWIHTAGKKRLAVNYPVSAAPWLGADSDLELVIGTTGADGSVLLQGLRPGMVVVRGRRESPTHAKVRVEAGEEVEAALHYENSLTVSGVVVDTDGRPIPMAVIDLARVATIDEAARQAGMADASGRFQLEGAPLFCSIGARAPGYHSAKLQRIHGSPGSNVQVQLRLAYGGCAIRGLVRENGAEAIPGALIRWRPLELSSDASDGRRFAARGFLNVRSDSEGKFELIGLAAGKSAVGVYSNGMMRWTKVVELGVGESRELAVELSRGCVCEGTVRLSSGKPVLGAKVALKEQPEWREVSTRCDEQGRFCLQGIPPGEHEVVVDANPVAQTRSKKLTFRLAVPARWDVTLNSTVTLRGRVVAQNGDGLHVPVMIMIPPTSDRSKWRMHEVVTDKKGKFERSGLAPGETVDIVVQQGVAERIHMKGVDPSNGEVVVAAKDPGAVCAFKGRVVGDSSGVPPRCVVLYTTPIGLLVQVVPDWETGEFSVKDLYEGPYKLSVQAPGCVPVTFKKELSSGESWSIGDVYLKSGGSIRLRVRGFAEGAPPRMHAMVFEEGKDDPIERINVVAGESKLSRSLNPGRYRVEIRGKGVAAKSRVVQVTDAGEKELVFGCQKGFELRGRLELAAVVEKSSTVVLIVKSSGRVVSRGVVPWIPGRIRPAALWLAAGEYSLELMVDGRTVSRSKVHVDEAQGPQRFVVTAKSNATVR